MAEETNERYDEIRKELVATAANYFTGTFREITRKSRSMLLLYSFSGIIWSLGIEVRKVAPGGVELSGILEMIPWILLVLIIYFLIQFILCLSNDLKHADVVGSSLDQLADKLHGMKTQDYDMEHWSLEDHVNALYVTNMFEKIWLFGLPVLISLVSIAFLFFKFFGWLADSPLC